jgi:hypothetical protein
MTLLELLGAIGIIAACGVVIDFCFRQLMTLADRVIDYRERRRRDLRAAKEEDGR